MVPGTESDRIERVLAGDRGAFVALFDAALPALWRFATRSCDDRAAAEALVRAVLGHAFRELGARPAGLPFAAWLCALAHERSARLERLQDHALAQAPVRDGEPAQAQ